MEQKFVKVYLIEYWCISSNENDSEKDIIDNALNRSFGKHETEIGIGKIEIVSAEVLKDESDCITTQDSGDGE